MTPADLLHEYRWTIVVALVGLFLLSRYIMRRANARRSAREHGPVGGPGEPSVVGPEGYRRARRQFLMTLLLLLTIVAVSVLTHLQ